MSLSPITDPEEVARIRKKYGTDNFQQKLWWSAIGIPEVFWKLKLQPADADLFAAFRNALQSDHWVITKTASCELTSRLFALYAMENYSQVPTRFIPFLQLVGMLQDKFNGVRAFQEVIAKKELLIIPDITFGKSFVEIHDILLLTLSSLRLGVVRRNLMLGVLAPDQHDVDPAWGRYYGRLFTHLQSMPSLLVDLTAPPKLPAAIPATTQKRKRG